MRFIKIYTQDQLVLLRNINPLLGKYRVPWRVIKNLDAILRAEELGRQGFIIVVLDPIKDLTRDLEDAVNLYPLRIEINNKLPQEQISDIDCEKSRGKEWFLSRSFVEEIRSQICVFYSVSRKRLYKKV